MLNIGDKRSVINYRQKKLMYRPSKQKTIMVKKTEDIYKTGKTINQYKQSCKTEKQN